MKDKWLEGGIDLVLRPHHRVRIYMLLSHCGVCLGLLVSSLPSDSNYSCLFGYFLS